MNKYSVTINGHRTSYSLEREFQNELEAIARKRDISLARLITKIDSSRSQENNLSSALRLHVLKEIKKQADQKTVPDHC